MSPHPNWPSTFDLLVRKLGAAPPVRDERGVITFVLERAAIHEGPLLELLPGTWTPWEDEHFYFHDEHARVCLSERAIAWIRSDGEGGKGPLSARIVICPDDQTFLRLLNSFDMRPPPLWCAAFEELVLDNHTESPGRSTDGAWTVQLRGDSTPERVLAILPGEWGLIRFDGESDSPITVYSCEQRGLAVFHDHYQAGLFGHVSVYPDDASFERAEAAVRADRFPIHEERKSERWVVRLLRYVAPDDVAPSLLAVAHPSCSSTLQLVVDEVDVVVRLQLAPDEDPRVAAELRECLASFALLRDRRGTIEIELPRAPSTLADVIDRFARAVGVEPEALCFRLT